MSRMSQGDFNRMLNKACYEGDGKLAALLLAQGADPKWAGESGKCSLHFASMGGDIGICKALCDHCPALLDARDKAGMTPLHMACRNANANAAKCLALAGADFEARDDFGRKPLELCTDIRVQSELEKLSWELMACSMMEQAMVELLSAL